MAQGNYGNAVLAVNRAAKGVLCAVHYYNKMKYFSFISGCAVRVVKRLKEDWLVVLWH